MTSADPLLPDKRLVRAAFDGAAAAYDEAAVLQREVAERHLERLDVVRMQPERILEVGTGTGYCSERLYRRYPRAELVALDLAPAMVARSRGRFSRWQRLRGRQRFVCGDAEALPLAAASADLLFSNLTLQWCGSPLRAFEEFHRVLRPGGLLTFTTFGPDTLKELRGAWAAVDGGVHVNRFVDMHDLGDALVAAGFADPVMDVEFFTLTYETGMGLMRDLKTIGAHNVNAGRGRGLTGRRRLQHMLAAYEQYRRDGLLPATYEVVYGHAWIPEGGAQRRRADGSVAVPITGIGGGGR